MAEEVAPIDSGISAFFQPPLWRPFPVILVGTLHFRINTWCFSDDVKVADDGVLTPAERTKDLILFFIMVLVSFV
jgi:hypothetical protein